MLSALYIFLPLITIAAVATLVVMYFSHKQQPFTFRTIFAAYFYIASLLALLAFLAGTATVGTALLSNVYGRDFSYQTYTYASDLDSATSPDQTTQEAELLAKNAQDTTAQEKDRIESLYQDDLYTGISVMIVGLLFLVTHTWGWRVMDQTHPRTDSMLFKAYIFGQLALYSLITLIALPVAISQLLRYLLSQATATQTLPSPGSALAVAVLALPVWIFFVWRAVKLAKD